MYWIATSPRLSRGRSTPEMRAIGWLSCSLALALLVARILANDAHDALAPHDLAVLAPNLDGRSDFHLMSFRTVSPLTSGRPCAFGTRSTFSSQCISSHFTARLGAARVPAALGRPSSRTAI